MWPQAQPDLKETQKDRMDKPRLLLQNKKLQKSAGTHRSPSVPVCFQSGRLFFVRFPFIMLMPSLWLPRDSNFFVFFCPCTDSVNCLQRSTNKDKHTHTAMVYLQSQTQWEQGWHTHTCTHTRNHRIIKSLECLISQLRAHTQCSHNSWCWWYTADESQVHEHNKHPADSQLTLKHSTVMFISMTNQEKQLNITITVSADQSQAGCVIKDKYVLIF